MWPRLPGLVPAALASSRQPFVPQLGILLPDEPVDQGYRQKTLSVLVSRAVTCECGRLSWDGPALLVLSALGGQAAGRGREASRSEPQYTLEQS